jgi:hypothetical protein
MAARLSTFRHSRISTVERAHEARSSSAAHVQVHRPPICPDSNTGHWRWKGKIKGTARRAFNGLSAHGFSQHAQKSTRAGVRAKSFNPFVESRATYAGVRPSMLESTYGVA